MFSATRPLTFGDKLGPSILIIRRWWYVSLFADSDNDLSRLYSNPDFASLRMFTAAAKQSRRLYAKVPSFLLPSIPQTILLRCFGRVPLLHGSSPVGELSSRYAARRSKPIRAGSRIWRTSCHLSCYHLHWWRSLPPVSSSSSRNSLIGKPATSFAARAMVTGILL